MDIVADIGMAINLIKNGLAEFAVSIRQHYDRMESTQSAKTFSSKNGVMVISEWKSCEERELRSDKVDQ